MGRVITYWISGQGPIQLGLELIQGWGIHHLSRQSFPVHHHTYKKVLPYVLSKIWPLLV